MEVFDGKEYRLNPMDEKIPVNDYLSAQGRFKALAAEDYPVVQGEIDKRWSELMALSECDENHS